MKKILFIALLLAGLHVDAQVTVLWANYPGGVATATDASNNVFTANWDYNAGGDITVTKMDPDGNILWNASYDNTNNTRHEVATWVETDSQGNVIISGTIRSGYSNPVNANSLLMKFSPTGTLLWRVVYETDFDGSSTKKCLIDTQDNIYILGRTSSALKVKKFSPSGNALWSYLDNAGIGAPVNFKFTPDNKIIITGRSITGSINGYAKIDLNGNNIWNITGINSLSVGDAAGDVFGNSYLINGQYGAGTTGSVLKKVSPAGSLIWDKINVIAGFRVETGTDNNPVISGFPNSGTVGAAFIKFDSNGNILWQNLDADGPSYNLLSHAMMKLDASNAAYLAASIMFQEAVCKVNSDGSSAWTATIAGGYAYDLDFGTDNSVFVAGGTTARLSQTGAPTLPTAPSNLLATASGTTSINLSWTDNSSNETSFVLQRSLSASSGFSTIISLAANTTSYSNTGLSASTTYYYRIQAVNAGGSSTWSNVSSATTATPATPPASPSNLVATAQGCNTIKLTWLDNSNNETAFEVHRSMTSNGTYSKIATLTSNTTTYTNTGLTKGKRYYYKVRATNSAGNSGFSNKANATATCPNNIAANSVLNDVKAYPNPVSNGNVTIELPADISFPVSLKLFNSSGLMILSKELQQSRSIINTETLVNGVYFLVIYGTGETKKLKLLIDN